MKLGQSNSHCPQCGMCGIVICMHGHLVQGVMIVMCCSVNVRSMFGKLTCSAHTCTLYMHACMYTHTHTHTHTQSERETDTLMYVPFHRFILGPNTKIVSTTITTTDIRRSKARTTPTATPTEFMRVEKNPYKI